MRGMRKLAVTVAQAETRNRGPLSGKTSASKGSQKGWREPAGLPGGGGAGSHSLSSWFSSRLCLSHLARWGHLEIMAEVELCLLPWLLTLPV